MSTQERITSFNEFLGKSKIPVLVDFWAEWCAPCRVMHPILKNVARNLSGKIKVIKVDVDSKPHIASRYQIRAIPTMILFKNSEPVWRMSGAIAEQQLIYQIEQQL